MKYGVKMRAEKDGRHISGAERIVGKEEIENATAALVKRALGHPNGEAKFINIKIQQIEREIKKIPPLKIIQPNIHSLQEAKTMLREKLSEMGIESRPVLELLYSLRDMRGAVFLDAKTLKRLDPDQKRGVRVSNMDYEGNEGSMKEHLREALCLASKVASCPYIIGELCISDDADYTTGYFASRECGYIRIANIKEKGERKGGRIFLFRGSREELDECIDYIENQPVLVVGDTSGI